MSNLIPGNQKHLTLEDRLYIEKALSNGTSFKDIARFLCKDPTTIAKEVRKHRLSDWYHKGPFYNAKNFCIHDTIAVRPMPVTKSSSDIGPNFMLPASQDVFYDFDRIRPHCHGFPGKVCGIPF